MYDERFIFTNAYNILIWSSEDDFYCLIYVSFSTTKYFLRKSKFFLLSIKKLQLKKWKVIAMNLFKLMRQTIIYCKKRINKWFKGQW